MNVFAAPPPFYLTKKLTLFLNQGSQDSQPITIKGWDFGWSCNLYTLLWSSSVEYLFQKLRRLEFRALKGLKYICQPERFDSNFRLQNNLCKFTTRTHKIQRLFCTKNFVLIKHYKFLIYKYVQIRLRFGIANSTNTYLWLDPSPKHNTNL